MKKNKEIVIAFFMGIFVMFFGKKVFQNKARVSNQDKFGAYYDVLNKWLKLKETNQTIEEHLKKKGIKTVAIYGMGDLGKHLLNDLKNTDIEVKYAIDRSFLAISEIDIYEPDADMPPVDAVIITPVFDYDSICKNLKLKVNCKLLSIADLVEVDKG